MTGFSDGLRKIGQYCFPQWIKPSRTKTVQGSREERRARSVTDPYAGSDAFRQGEKYLFGINDLVGETVDDPLGAALNRFEAAHDYGHGLGSVVAGIFYECAIGMCVPDYQKAYRYYEEAAEHGEPLGACLLATMPGRVPMGLIPGDYKQRKRIFREAQQRYHSPDALSWLRQAAEQYQVGEAFYMLGSCMEQGIGVGSRRSPEDAARTAVSLYLDGAKRGVKASRRMLAQCLLNGVGMETESPSEARYWLMRAIHDNRDAEAMVMLSQAYENGRFSGMMEDNDDAFLDPSNQKKLKALEDKYNQTGQIKHVRIAEALADAENTTNQAGVASDSNDSDTNVSWTPISGSENEFVNRYETTQARRHQIRDNRECFYWAKQSVETGSIAGLAQLARCYEVAIGVAADNERCIELYSAAAKEGYAPAKFSLACIHFAKDRDNKRAEGLLREAAEAGYPPAMISLASLHSNRSEAMQRLKHAGPVARMRTIFAVTAVLKDRDTTRIAATMSDSELQTALIWWRRAAKRGSSRQAQFELAQCYRDGLGCRVDITKALFWMQKAAEEGLPEAQLELGVLLVQNLPAPSTARDNEAFYWILRAAKNGHTEAQIELAQLFCEGRHVHRNLSTAFYWFKRAAQAGNAYGQFRVGAMLIDGDVVEGCVGGSQSQLSEAVKWLKLASEQGWTDADRLFPVALGMATEESVKAHNAQQKTYIY